MELDLHLCLKSISVDLLQPSSFLNEGVQRKRANLERESNAQRAHYSFYLQQRTDIQKDRPARSLLVPKSKLQIVHNLETGKCQRYEGRLR